MLQLNIIGHWLGDLDYTELRQAVLFVFKKKKKNPNKKAYMPRAQVLHIKADFTYKLQSVLVVNYLVLSINHGHTPN